MDELCKSITDYSVAMYYKTITEEKIICYDQETHRCYHYIPSTALYVKVGVNTLIQPIRELLAKRISQEMKGNFNNFQQLAKLLSKVGDYSFITKVAKSLCSLCYEPNFLERLDTTRNHVNFRNGLVDLQTGKFRQRTSDDYVTMCLPYDYTDKKDKATIARIKQLMLQICNDDKKLLQFNLSWLGYNLTGETKEQLFLCIIGYQASNGKSTLYEMHESSQSIYSWKMDKNAFSVDNSKRHKQLAMIKNKRMVRIEEGDRKKLDMELLKCFADTGTINNEVMYGNSEMIQLYCKLTWIANSHPNLDADEGVARRGLLEEFRNRFIDEPEYNKLDNKKGHYIKDRTLATEWFKTDLFRLSYFQIVLPYAVDYYQNGLQNVNLVKQQFKDIIQESDKFKEYVEANYEKTGNRSDKIHKDQFLNAYKQFANLQHLSWMTLLNDIKRIQLEYDRTTTKPGWKKQGCLIGLKLKDGPMDEDPLDHGVEEKEMAVKPKKKPTITKTKRGDKVITKYKNKTVAIEQLFEDED